MENNGLLYVSRGLPYTIDFMSQKKNGGIKWYKPQRWLSCLK